MTKYTTLVDTATLAAASGRPEVAIVDCRFDLANPGAGEQAYARAHIPGAVYAHLDRHLSGPKTGTNGRHPLPEPDVLEQTLGAFGIDRSTQVFVYDQDTGMYASRLWWLLRWMGHEAVAVLDGGFAQWTAEQRPTAAGVETRSARVFSGAPNAAMVAGTGEIMSVSKSGGILVDARAAERYRGDVEPIDPVAGHIPSAVNYFYMQNLADGRFRSPEELRAQWRAAIGNRKADQVVSYCGSGVTACHNVLALEHAGWTGARLYAGSWSEWVSDAERPVERG
jgi:thiosulfate/3-mercaptopyruvate sulfurtransferase